MATLRVTEDSPTKFVLELATPNSSNWADYRSSFIKALLIFVASVLVFIFAPPDFMTWLFLIIGIGALLVQFIFIYAGLSSPKEAKVIIDLNTEHITRIQKAWVGKEKKQVLEFEQVSHILVNAEEVGHHCKVTLESQSNPRLEVNFAVGSDAESFKALGKKIGILLNKPVVFKHTDSGNLISEETLQS